MGGRILTHTLTITTTGGAGAATGSAVTTGDPIEGFLLDLYVNYHASAPGTTDIIVKQTDRTESLYAKANSVTDAYVCPRSGCVDTTATAITNSHTLIPINGTITASLAECDALTGACVVTVRVQTL